MININKEFLAISPLISETVHMKRILFGFAWTSFRIQPLKQQIPLPKYRINLILTAWKFYTTIYFDGFSLRVKYIPGVVYRNRRKVHHFCTLLSKWRILMSKCSSVLTAKQHFSCGWRITMHVTASTLWRCNPLNKSGNVFRTHTCSSNIIACISNWNKYRYRFAVNAVCLQAYKTQ